MDDSEELLVELSELSESSKLFVVFLLLKNDEPGWRVDVIPPEP